MSHPENDSTRLGKFREQRSVKSRVQSVYSFGPLILGGRYESIQHDHCEMSGLNSHCSSCNILTQARKIFSGTR